MTGVSLVTSHGPHGKNVMAAEWTMQISYKPMLIAVFIHEGSYTLKNIRRTKQFGVNMASEEQSTLVSVAGGYSRNEVDKLKIHDLFQLNDSKNKIPLIANCVINMECKLHSIKKIGDHNMVVGKVTSIRHDETKKPLVYHRNRYYRIGKIVEPKRTEVEVNQKTFNMFCQNQNKFILKFVGTLIRSKNKVLVLDKSPQIFTIPCVQPRKNQDNKKELETYLKLIKLPVVLKNEPSIKRLVIKNKNKTQRINFVLFDGMLCDESKTHQWKIINSNSFLESLTK